MQRTNREKKMKERKRHFALTNENLPVFTVYKSLISVFWWIFDKIYEVTIILDEAK